MADLKGQRHDKPKDTTRLKEQHQKIFSPIYGDCWRACMASWLELPADVLPNDHSPAWSLVWETFLSQFGLTLSHPIRSDGPLWAHETWVASVKSLNLEGTHAILMHNANQVLFDPSTHRKYRKGQRLSSDVVLSGHHLGVSDVTKLHRLNDYRQRLLGDQGNGLASTKQKTDDGRNHNTPKGNAREEKK